MDKIALIPRPEECIELYMIESLKKIGDNLKEYRESSFDITPYSKLPYEDAIVCGKRIKTICELRGWTVSYVTNNSANKNRWVAMKIYKK